MIEFQREKKVISMMITAHSVLRDRYLRLANFFEITLLVASVILNVVVFIDAGYITRITGIDEDSQKLIAGLSSVTVFAISIVLLQVRWKERAENHCKAADELFALLHDCRNIEIQPEGQEKNENVDAFVKKYFDITSTLTKIPDKKFNSLKLIHYRKKELSKLIEKYPRSRLFILKIKLFLSSFKEKTN